MQNDYLQLVEQFKATKEVLMNPQPYYMDLALPQDDFYNSVCIVGGGLAGYLSAIAFRKFFNIPVTVIEPSHIPPIGVGEATTPLMADYLFGVLELDKQEFFRMVEPTWKLGIKFFWGKPGDYYFNYPFDTKDILSAYLHSGDVNECSLNSLLMRQDASFIARYEEDGTEKYHSLSKNLKYAYHLDNRKFIDYLKFAAARAGVIFLDEEIKDAVLNEEGEVAALINVNGDKFVYDLYVDCSGFKSMLLEKKMNVPYVSFQDSLFNDRAVTGILPNNGHIKCYTTAETMDNGWCWNIPLRHEDHRGYVYSSAHCTEEQAIEEMLRKNPGMSASSIKHVRFRSGRHERFVEGNVVAIGNAYSFVEPLESTGVHMIIDQIILLMNHFVLLKKNPALRNLLNDTMKEHWEYIRWFLSIHFKYNKKFDTPYWKDCRANGNTSGFEKFLSLYKEIGLLSRQDTTTRNMIQPWLKDTIFDVYGIDHILFCQGVLPGNIQQLSPENKADWNAMLHVWKNIAAKTIPLREDLDIMLKHPQLL
ncbi:tryptophan halogenase [Chitinophaga skermanii]|uniref:Tryptophan halogenase n=1 Tax=Chitinophaga skermanii TaxID=331697 RepID=A0A327QY37_9BACT|nr:tryptophan halogenase family protein [Chitinophaga skermanii]RAJ08323.1 tryptophan halogenase [Chitinophaga skermanii]